MNTRIVDMNPYHKKPDCMPARIIKESNENENLVGEWALEQALQENDISRNNLLSHIQRVKNHGACFDIFVALRVALLMRNANLLHMPNS